MLSYIEISVLFSSVIASFKGNVDAIQVGEM